MTSLSASAISTLNGNPPPLPNATRLPGAVSTGNATRDGLSRIETSARFKPDISQMSPFVELNALPRLYQSDQSKYEQVTHVIAVNLKDAAVAAQSQGNPSEAIQLTQLAGAFTNASQSIRLIEIQDLVQAVVGFPRTPIPTNLLPFNPNQLQNQYIAVFPATETQDYSLGPLGIILRTLASAGVIRVAQS